jgi:hypothetical protein
MLKGTPDEQHLLKVMELIKEQNELIKQHTALIREVKDERDRRKSLSKDDRQEAAKNSTILGREDVKQFKAVFQRGDYV